MEEPFKKRRTSEDLGINNLIQNEDDYLIQLSQAQTIWSDALFSMGSPLSPDDILSPGSSRGRKRSHIEYRSLDNSPMENNSTELLLANFEDSIRVEESQGEVPDLENPFAAVSQERHPKNQAPKITLPQNYVVDGYVKIRLTERQNIVPVHYQRGHSAPFRYDIPGLPENFGRTFKFDTTDKMLMKFFVLGVCSGRSLIPRSNGWLVVLCPMAEGDECIKHALLAFSSAYALDLDNSERLRQRANYHYSKAIDLLSARLKDRRNFKVGREDVVVAALRILWSDYIVNWQLRKRGDNTWYKAIQQAKYRMAITDPGYRYWEQCNVQCSTARQSNANMLAYVDILSQPLTPLAHQDLNHCHPWLLEGQKKETLTINGGTGLCPKLLHIFGQITHLCVMLGKDPESTMLRHGGDGLERVIIGICQSSDLSSGYTSAKQLLDTCVLNEIGQVETEAEVTNLTAEAWRQAALIYLRCRFFRLPRGHAAVERPLDLLLRCVKRMPATGRLFTSQSPLGPIFLAGLVAVKPVDRSIIRNWFRTVTSKGSKSSVPPLWSIMHDIWEWMDSTRTLTPDLDVDEKPIGHRIQWWEQLAEQAWYKEGRIAIV